MSKKTSHSNPSHTSSLNTSGGDSGRGNGAGSAKSSASSSSTVRSKSDRVDLASLVRVVPKIKAVPFNQQEKVASDDPRGYGRSRDLAVSSSPSGGYVYNDKEYLDQQKKVIWEFVKQLGSVFADGLDLVNFSLPIGFFEPKSHLERLVMPWSYAPVFLTRASLLALAAPTSSSTAGGVQSGGGSSSSKEAKAKAEIMKEFGPSSTSTSTSEKSMSDKQVELELAVERMKWVICFAISAFHLNVEQKKPFNPILGETYQAKFDDGSMVYLEQTSHHPPVSHWQVIGPQNCYTYTGYGVWHASISGIGSSVKAMTKGEHVVSFKDGSKVTWNFPVMYIKGMVYGDRVVEFFGNLHFEDKKNGIACDIKLDPEAKGFIKSLFSRAPTAPTDYFRGTIYRTTGSDDEGEESGRTSTESSGSTHSNPEVLSTVEGSWLTSVIFDDQVYWDVSQQEQYAKFPVPIDNPLPSDSRNREDRNALLEGDMEAAREYKLVLEEKQRYDKKLRKEGLAAVQQQQFQ